MSAVAVTLGAYCLARFNQDKGTLLGSSHGKVVVLGGGVVGRHAARAARRIGAEVFLSGRRPERETALKRDVAPGTHSVLSNADSLGTDRTDANLLVGAVLSRGGREPLVVTEVMVQVMEPGSVILEVSIDQGGCVATSRPTPTPTRWLFGIGSSTTASPTCPVPIRGPRPWPNRFTLLDFPKSPARGLRRRSQG